jgi:hypothetical protein
MAPDYPIVINCRDRVTPLRKLVSWLEEHGHRRILMVDNASTYPPLLNYYQQTRHYVVRLDTNMGHLAPWRSGAIDVHVGADEYYVESDCDVVPDPACPNDLLAVLRRLLDLYPEHVKAGLGLRTDNLPLWYRHRRSVVRWERRFWATLMPHDDPGLPPLYEAPIDTTFAMYRPSENPTLDTAIRTGWPYVGRHEPWYLNSWRQSAEQRYYVAHASPGITTWEHDRLPNRVRGFLAEQDEAAGRRTRANGDR